jgi:signal transduction histidine kinase
VLLHNLGDSESAVVFPLLLECNTEGEVTWMSERTRTLLGQPRNVVSALGTAASAGRDYRVWRILTLSDGLLMGAQSEFPGDSTVTDEIDLRRLSDHFVLHYFRLERVERRLAGKRRGSNAAKLQRQMEEERNRLGRELHTDVGQLLTAVGLQLNDIVQHLPDAIEAVRSALARIRELLAKAIDLVRNISRRVHMPDMLEHTLEEAIRQMWETSGIPQNYAAELDLQPLPSEPDLHVKTAVYRAAQEALSNLARHARATRVRMSMALEGDDIVLRVFDDGATPDPEQKENAKKTWGIGLRSIREQVEALGGRLTLIHTAEGFTLEVRVPLHGGD